MVGKGDKRKGIWVDGGHPNTYVILNWFIRESPEKNKKQKTILQAIVVCGERVYVWLAYGGLGVDCSRRMAEELSTVPFSRDLTNASVNSVAQLCPILCDPMDCSTPGFPVHHQLNGV